MRRIEITLTWKLYYTCTHYYNGIFYDIFSPYRNTVVPSSPPIIHTRSGQRNVNELSRVSFISHNDNEESISWQETIYICILYLYYRKRSKISFVLYAQLLATIRLQYIIRSSADTVRSLVSSCPVYGLVSRIVRL